MGKIAEIWVEIGAKIENFNRNMSDVQKATVKIGESLQDAGKKMTLVGGAIVASLGLMIKKTSDFGEELWDLTQRTGISAETLSALKLSADKSGTAIGEVARGMRFLADEMIKTSNAGDTSKTILGQLGVAAKNTDGSMRPLNDVLFDVADRFATMEDGAVKVKLAVELFGRSGMSIIPMLNLGSQGLKENAEMARKLGLIYTNEDAKACDAFNDAMIQLKGAMAGSFKVIASSLIPVVKDLAEKITAAIAKVQTWAKEHPYLIRMVKDLALALGGLGVLLTASGPLLFGVGKFMTMYAKLPSILKTASLAVLAAAGAIKLLTAAYDAHILSMDRSGKGMTDDEKAWQRFTNGLEKATGGMTDFVRLAILAHAYHPKLAAGLNLVESGVSDLSDKYGGFRSTLKAIYEGKEGEAFQKFLERLGGNALKAVEGIKPLKESVDLIIPSLDFGKQANEKFGQVADWVAQRIDLQRNNIEALATVITEKLTDTALPKARDTFKAFGDQIPVVTGEVKSNWETLCTDLGQSWAQLFEDFTNKAVTFGNFFQTVWKNIGSMFKKFISQMVADYAAGVMKQVLLDEKAAKSSMISKVMAGIPFPLNLFAVAGALAAVSALFSKIGLAEGGIVDRPTLAVIGEHGREAVVPLDKPGAFGGPRNLYLHNDIYLGGQKVAQQIVKIVEEQDALGNLRLRKALA